MKAEKYNEASEAFRQLLINIIGEKFADCKKASAAFGKHEVIINVMGIRHIISGRHRPTQAYIRKKKFSEILAKEYPDSWPRFALADNAFETRVLALSPKGHKSSAGKKIDAPANENSFAYAFWLALGGENYRGGMTELFSHAGSNYITGTGVPTLKNVEEEVIPRLKKVRSHNARHFDLLRFYAVADQLSAAKIKSGIVDSTPFRKAAGYFLHQAREQRGHSLPELQKQIERTTPVLKDKLAQIETGDVSPSIMRSAIKEVTEKLKLETYAPTTVKTLQMISGVLQHCRR